MKYKGNFRGKFNPAFNILLLLNLYFTGAMLKFLTSAGSSQSASGEPVQSSSSTGTNEPDTPATDESVPSGTVEAVSSGSTSSASSVQPPLSEGNKTASEASAGVEPQATVCASPNDPAEWPSVLTDSIRTELVRRGPFQPGGDFSFPKDKSRRACHPGLFQRRLSNGEIIKRSWLSYSVKNDATFCFCCKLFSKKTNKIIVGGVNDWSNINAVLRQHEGSPEHTKSMIKWKELDLRLSHGKTLDHIQMTALEAERKRWRDVLTRLLSITQSLAERNLAFRGSSDKLYQPDNGNFLREVELLAKYDPVMENHVSRIKDGETHAHYLSKDIQNELIQLVSDQILATIVAEVRHSKYFSLILDCTPDISHQEQMSIILRSVSLKGQPEIKEHFLGFVNVEATTGLNLTTVILDKLADLKIPFDNCRGQAYDNGANMKGKHQGVQARLLRMNPRAVFVPCGAHTLNLIIADAAKSSKDAVGFFGYVQKLFTFFSAGTQRWSILKKHVNITVKSWSDTRWESRLQSVHAVRHQASKIREALLEARQTVNDPVAKVEAQSLAEEVGSYRFLICCVVWCEILSRTNTVNKLLQSASMQLDIAVQLISTAKASLTLYRDTGFSDAQTTAQSICEEMNVEPVLKEKRLRTTKKHFSYESSDEPVVDALRNLEVNFFNIVVDTAIASVDERFETLNKVKKQYGVVLNFSSACQMSDDPLMAECMEMEKALTFNEESDISGVDLAEEIKNLPPLPSSNMTAFELLSFLCEKNLEELYPNLWIALRIGVTLPVTVASAERSFSKLKIIKSYLRSTMSQERLSGLAIMSINHDMGKKICYDDIIDDFASRKCRKGNF